MNNNEVDDVLDKIVQKREDEIGIISINKIEKKEPLKPKRRIIDAEFVEVKPKISYQQDWDAYDKAKTNEDQLFKKLLEELLLLGVEEPISKRTGT